MSVIIGTPPAQGSGGQWQSNIVGKIGTSDYTLLYDGTGSGDGKIHCFKRVSGAIVWNEMDLAHAVHLDIIQTYIPSAGGTLQYCSWVDGTTIFLLVLQQHSTAGPTFFIDGWDIFSFNTSTDTWNNSGGVVSTFANGSGGTTVEISYNAGAPPGSVSQCNICMIVRGTNDYVFYHSGPSQTISSVLYGRLYRSFFNGSAFSGQTQIPGQTGITDRFLSLGGLFDGTNSHYFMYIDGGSPNKNITHVGENGGGFGTAQNINAGFPTGLYYTGLFPLSTVTRPILYTDNSSNPKIGIAGEFWTEPFDSSQCLGFINATPALNPTWSSHQILTGSDDIAGSFPWHSDTSLFPVHQGNDEQCISLAADNTTGNLILAWCTTDETAHRIGHVYYATSLDGSTWSFPNASIIDAAQLSTNDNPMVSVFAYADADAHSIGIIGNQDSPSDFLEESQWFQFSFSAPGPSCTLNATKTSITKGESTILYWTSTGSPTSGVIDNGVGAVIVPTGSVSVMPTVTTTYHLTVTNSNGSSQCQVTITVNPCNLSSQFEQDFSFFQ